MHRIFCVVLLSILLISTTGCTTTQKGAAIGGLAGATVGGAGCYLFGGQKTDDALVGAAVGAATGAIIGGLIGYFSEE